MFLNPKQILDKLDLRDDMIACDLGCGSGGWVIPLAKILENGRVYAVDILEEPLSVLSSKLQTERISNVEKILADIEKGVKIQEGLIDLVLMTNLLFQVDNKKEILSEAKRILNPNGKILVIDWKKTPSVGPKEGRVSAEEIKEAADSIGLKTEEEFEAGKFHWGLILKK